MRYNLIHFCVFTIGQEEKFSFSHRDHTMQVKLLLLIATLTVPAICSLAQESKKEDEIRFVALEEYEKRGKVLQIREKLLYEITAKQDREKNILALEATFGSIARMSDGDKQIVEYINLRRSVLEALDEVKDSNLRQVEIAGLIDSSMAAGGLLPQVSNYLTEARTQLRAMGVAQQSLGKRLEKTLNLIKTAMLSVPPPKMFTNKSGIEMRLVPAGQLSFYISFNPVSQNGMVSLTEAVGNTRVLSSKEGALYRLPDLSELKILSQVKLYPKTAIWSIAKWQSSDAEAERMSGRFGVTLYFVWDPARVLGREETFGELPFAKYGKLDYYVVTSAKTGWQHRWDTIIASMRDAK